MSVEYFVLKYNMVIIQFGFEVGLYDLEIIVLNIIEFLFLILIVNL